MNQETKVGLFLIIALSIIAASAVMLGGINIFSRRAKYFADFVDVEALPPKAAVKISGVEVGKVLGVDLIDQKARVTLGIKPGTKLYGNAIARIGSTGIIGTRFVELETGTPDNPLMEPGSVIQAEDGVGLSDVMKRVSTLFEDDDEYGDASMNLKATLYNIRVITDALKVAMGDRPEDLTAIVSNIKALTQSARTFTKDLAEITQERKEDVKVALGKFRDISDKLDNLLGRIEKGEGTIGALMSDEETANNVKSAVASIKDTAASAKKVLGRFTLIDTYWNYRFRYDTRDEEGRSDAGVTIVPRPGKFYAVGVSNIGAPISNEKHLVHERKNRITAVMGADWGPFTGYAGAIRSDGGVGLNFRPLWWSKEWNRRLELTAEASDFSRERVVKGRRIEGTVYNVGGRVALTRWLWVGARGEDLGERGAFMGYTNIVFRDEDLAYLLGFASFAR